MNYGYIGGADGPTAILVSHVGEMWNPINWFGVITVLLILLPNIVCAVIFAFGHIGVTRENIKNSIHMERSAADDI